MKIGDRVSGRYKLIEKIGSGGMSNVYLATDLILERNVAVKLLSFNFREDQDSLRRFQREALATTELTHPNIVNIFDVGEGDQPYIVMEHIEGMDLKQYIRENHPIPYHKVIDIMEQILDGIAYAHDNDVIHRDIKPHNILIDKDGRVKITDFGIAVALSQNSITQTNSLLGSVHYISPEQARGNIVTKQSDIYSLGIVLYELLTGTVPFDGESAVSIALKHFQSEIPSLRELDSRMPQALENVVLKATAKEPRQRYASVREMKEDLSTSLSAARIHEEKFIPADPFDEDTLVLDGRAIKAQAAALEASNADEDTMVVGEDEKPTVEEPKKKSRWWLMLIPVLLGLLIWLVIYLGRPQQVQIPNELIGLTLDEAVELLEERSLEVGEVVELPNDEVDEGLVFRVNPQAGATVLEGAEVDLYVSLGEEPFEIEDYTGEVYEEIRAELTDLGMRVESTDEPSEEYEAGEIIRQDIEPGEKVKVSETTINFAVSTGRPSVTFEDLTESTRTEVNNYINNIGINLTITLLDEPSDDIPQDRVARQEPAAGTTLYAGDSVTIWFSSGPEEVEEPEPETIRYSAQIIIPYEEKREDPNDENSPLVPSDIKIYIDDYNNDINNLYREFSITENRTETLNFLIEEGSNARYIVERDGEKIMDKTAP